MSLENKQSLIITADDFGSTKSANAAIFEGFKSGLLTSASIIPNGQNYAQALNFSADLPDVIFGIHLNLTEGKSLSSSQLFCDSNGNFNLKYFDIFKKSFDNDFLNAAESEFRAQIEHVKKDFKVNQINSHFHIHSIPNLFKLVVKLAKEYDIPYVRTHFEPFYFSFNSVSNHLNLKYPLNLFKHFLFNYLTEKNLNNLDNLTTNDYLLGIMYNGIMSKNTVTDGLKYIDSGLVEVVLSPDYEKETFEDILIKDEINQSGFEFISPAQENSPVLK